MYYIGMDLHKQDLVMAVEEERGPVGRVRRIACRDTGAIRAAGEPGQSVEPVRHEG